MPDSSRCKIVQITVVHNSAGFRDTEFVDDQRPRILFIGDSNVWGFDAEAHERFTDLLQEKYPDWQMINAGVSGFGTDQIYLLLPELLKQYRPAVVLMVVNKNDRADNLTNFRYGTYYKPYFIIDNDQLQLRGVPVPKSVRYHAVTSPLIKQSYLLRAILLSYQNLVHPPINNADPTEHLVTAIKNMVETQGATLYLSFASAAPYLEEHCKRVGISYARLQNKFYYRSFAGTGRRKVINLLRSESNNCSRLQVFFRRSRSHRGV